MLRELVPWSYVIQNMGKDIYHVIDNGLNPLSEDETIAVATLEYTREANGLYSKEGIRKPWIQREGGEIRVAGKTFDGRHLPTVDLKLDSFVVEPTNFLRLLLGGKIDGNHSVPVNALRYFVNALNLHPEEIACIGIEGSLCIGQAGQQSDLDLLVYGYENYLNVVQRLKELFELDQNIIPLKNFKYGQEELTKRRKDHSPFSVDELLYITARRPYFYIMQRTDDSTVYTKVSLFGIVGNDDGEYRSNLDLFLNPIQVQRLGVSTISGQVTDDTLGITIPSVWEINSTYDGRKIDYIVDYAGIFPEHVRKDEKFEARGMVEAYTDSFGNSGYRLVIAYWDQHVANGMYVKPILE